MGRGEGCQYGEIMPDFEEAKFVENLEPTSLDYFDLKKRKNAFKRFYARPIKLE